MAGGFGTRLGEELNPKSCKSLIEYKGQTLIAHLIDNLKSAGIQNILIATNEHSHQEILEIAKSKDISPHLQIN
jgi:choline kinase